MPVEAPKTVYMFPGQGSQKQGMNGELLARGSEQVKQMYDRANELLRDEFFWNVDLRDLTLNGPQSLLDQTEYAQPALFVASAARFDKLANGRVLSAAVIGHSLGEFPALYAAGSVSFEECLRAVVERGRLMKEAGEKRNGGMAVVKNLSEAEIEALCARIKSDLKDDQNNIVVTANINSPSQIVISGDMAAIDLAGRLASEFHTKVIRLPVSIAAHSPLMADAGVGMQAVLAAVTIHEPCLTVYSPTTAGRLNNPDDIRAAFVAQLTGRVLWIQTILNMRKDGIFAFIDVGPGEVLTGLVRDIDKAHHKATMRVGPIAFPVTFTSPLNV